jgi:4-amino-4-deoxy-L-arabinose transferase-like glycosyltransferase
MRFERPALLGVLLAAAGIRAWGLFSGIPFAVGIDEPVIVERALTILRTGDWNTHAFDYPSFVVYFHAMVAAARFLAGATSGEWSNLAAASPAAFYGWARVAAAAVAVLTVWIVFRLGKRLESPLLGLLAAAQLAVMPLHVRESRFALTDVPATFLVALALLLTVRASRERTPAAYAAAGAAAGLAASAKYNAAVVLLPVLVAWAFDQRHPGWRGRRVATPLLVLGTFAVSFVAVTPYSILDLPNFLNGFGAQLARFSAGARTLAEPAGILYLKHLNAAASAWLPLAATGTALALVSRTGRAGWVPVATFLAAYGYVLATHPLVFARYALPLVPVLCLFAGLPIVRLGKEVRRRASRAAVAPFVMTAAALIVLAPFTAVSVNAVSRVKKPDTRTIAAERMRDLLPQGSVVAVESYGPTNLDQAGFGVVLTERLFDHDLDWYVARGVGYLVVSSGDLRPYEGLVRAAPLLQLSPTDGQWGPAIYVFRVTSAD